MAVRAAFAMQDGRCTKRGRFLRAYFGKGNGCLMLALWFITIMIATIFVTMLTVSL